MSERVVQNRPGRGGAEVVGRPGVEGGVDALLDYDEDQLGLVVGEGFETREQLRDLVQLDALQLAVGHAVPVHHDLLWQVVVHLESGAQTSYTV